MYQISETKMLARDPKSARIGGDILPLEMGYLPEFFQKKAKIELKDTPEIRKKSLEEMKKMMKSDPNVSGIHYSDDFLMLFLLARKHDVLNAFKQLKAYTNYKKKYLEIFTNPHFDSLVAGAKWKVITFFPWRCTEGCAIVHISMGNWDPSTLPFEEAKKYYVVVFTQALRDPMTQVNGFKIILDLNPKLNTLKYFTPQALYMLYTGIQVCLPGRLKEIHCTNANAIGRMVWFLARPLMSEKFRSRVFFHEETKELLDFFPPAIIPQELGGDLEDCDSVEWLRKVMQPDKLKHSDFIELTS